MKSQGATVEEFWSRLEQARRRLARGVEATDTELATLEVHPAGGFAEDASTEAAASILALLADRERRELDEVDAAQARLAAGTFGVCADCHRPIALSRLRANPAARHCLGCQRRAEARAEVPAEAEAAAA